MQETVPGQHMPTIAVPAFGALSVTSEHQRWIFNKITFVWGGRGVRSSIIFDASYCMFNILLSALSMFTIFHLRGGWEDEAR